MEGLSIEKKAMAYDKVVNKLKCFMAQGVDTLITRDNVQDFFSELKDEKIDTFNLSKLDSLIERLTELKDESSGNNCDIIVHLGKRKFKIVGAYLDSSPHHHKEEIGIELENFE